MSILFIPILLLILFLVEQAVFPRFWNKGLSSQLTFQSHPVVEGEKTSLTEEISNRSWFPLPILQVNFKLGRGLFILNTSNVTVSDKTNMTELFSLRPWQKITRTLSLECKKRGYYQITENSLIAGDLFTGNTCYMQEEQNSELYVYPKMIDKEAMDVPFSYLMGEVRSRMMLYEDVFAFRGIRDYAPQDPMGKINWKASARTGELKVNLREYTSGQKVVILLNVEEPLIYFPEVILEESIRYALTLSSQLLDQQIPVGILSNGRDAITGGILQIEGGSSSSHLTTICEGLSRIDLTQKAEDFKTLIQNELFHGEEEMATSEGMTKGQDLVTYVLISSSRQDSVLETAKKISFLQQGLLWICPVTYDMDQTRYGKEYGIEMQLPIVHKN